jgi:hypothetical protein
MYVSTCRDLCGAHSVTCLVSGSDCGKSGQSTKHTTASDFEVKDMPDSFT